MLKLADSFGNSRYFLLLSFLPLIFGESVYLMQWYMIAFIVARAQNGVIGFNNRIPWHLPEDLQIFKQITRNHTIIMGRKTWDSLPKKPLPQRDHIIISRQNDLTINHPNVRVMGFAQSVAWCNQQSPDTAIFVIGGAEIYQLFLPHCQIIYISQLAQEFHGDAHFGDEILRGFHLTEQTPYPSATIPFTLEKWQKMAKI